MARVQQARTTLSYFEKGRTIETDGGGLRLASAPVSVSLIVPALNEADGLRCILPRIPGDVDELLIIDGHSGDDTADVVAKLAPNALLVRQAGRGKGDALKTGLALATGEIIITMDADGSMNPEDIPSFIAQLRSGCDFVKGSRVLPGAGSDDFTRVRRAGNTWLTWLANIVFGSAYTDLTFGFNGYWHSTVAHLGLLADGFEFEIQLALRAATVGMRTGEVPTHEPPRVGGVSKLHPIRDGLAILKIILAEASPRRASRFGSQIRDDAAVTNVGGATEPERRIVGGRTEPERQMVGRAVS
jgi:glycosyltransferase involved in cell wall biosynthesis